MYQTEDCPVVKIDSNVTGLSYAWERCFKELPAASAAQAGFAMINVVSQPGIGDTFVVEGESGGGNTFTFVDDGDVVDPGADIETDGNLALLRDNMVAALNANADVSAKFTAEVQAPYVVLIANVPGSAGNGAQIELGGSAPALAPNPGADPDNDNIYVSAGGVDEAVGPIWKMLEPNSYSDFGSTINTVARNPINRTRQRRKGTATGVDATGGFTQDLTHNNTFDLLQGFCFAMARQRLTTDPLNGNRIPVASVSATQFTVTGTMPAFPVGSIIKASGFANSANNGVFNVTSRTGSTVSVDGNSVAEATPPAEAKLELVGFNITGYSIAGRVLIADVEDFGLIPGEWFYISGTTDNDGFARAVTVNEDDGEITFDKATFDPSDEAGAGVIQIYLGTVIRNEPDPANITRGTIQLERTLGNDADGVQSEYLTGQVPNELTINIPQEDKITVDLAFVGADAEYRTGAQGLKAGLRPYLTPMDAINSSSDFKRIKLSTIIPGQADPVPLYSFATDLSVTLNNNASAIKAVGSFGAVEMTAGTFEVGGSITAYFMDLRAVNAVRQYADCTMDIITVSDNMGFLIDIPLMALGNGRLAVEQDQAITIPLENSAFESSFGYTLLTQQFPFIPSV